jgi:iron complex transport system ATP-binding protein
MDEPIFALEPYQKERVMDFMTAYARSTGLSIYFSLHELDLSEKYSDHLMIFDKDSRNDPQIGPTAELYRKDIIEQAYDVPFIMLKNREALFRDHMIRTRGIPGPPEQET